MSTTADYPELTPEAREYCQAAAKELGTKFLVGHLESICVACYTEETDDDLAESFVDSVEAGDLEFDFSMDFARSLPHHIYMMWLGIDEIWIEEEKEPMAKKKKDDKMLAGLVDESQQELEQALMDEAFAKGVADGLENPADLTSGVTYPDKARNERYDAGVNRGQKMAKDRLAGNFHDFEIAEREVVYEHDATYYNGDAEDDFGMECPEMLVRTILVTETIYPYNINSLQLESFVKAHTTIVGDELCFEHYFFGRLTRPRKSEDSWDVLFHDVKDVLNVNSITVTSV